MDASYWIEVELILPSPTNNVWSIFGNLLKLWLSSPRLFSFIVLFSLCRMCIMKSSRLICDSILLTSQPYKSRRSKLTLFRKLFVKRQLRINLISTFENLIKQNWKIFRIFPDIFLLFSSPPRNFLLVGSLKIVFLLTLVKEFLNSWHWLNFSIIHSRMIKRRSEVSQEILVV